MDLSILKRLQAGWIIKLYNKMTSLHGKNIISKGWEKTGIDDESKWELLDYNHQIRLIKPIVRGRKEILDNDLMAVLIV